MPQTIEKWGMFELAFHGKSDGNPYTDYEIRASFKHDDKEITVNGFYDGDGIYRVRFMPEYEGEYTYTVTGSCFAGDVFAAEERSGSFFVAPPKADNHGMVRVAGKRYMAYADGTPYHSIGTTCYAFINQNEDLQEQTMETLAASCFNKIRFCIFPKFYQYNETEPVSYPYMRGEKRGQDEKKEVEEIKVSFYTEKTYENIRDFDCYTLNDKHFKRFDKRIGELNELGIETDIILFHPYDKWGFSSMKKECNELYLRYMVARYGAYKNVWWSMANEYDLLNFAGWTNDEWAHYGRLVAENDSYGHMLSIHNCISYYDYREDWITHCSMQRVDWYVHVEETDKHLTHYEKPVVWDEICYEGNIDLGWGNISAKELVRRFWEATLRGGCAGHGETYINDNDILWWSHGGRLHGESEPRLAFLKKIWDETPNGNLKAAPGAFDELVSVPDSEDREFDWVKTGWCSYEIHYFGIGRPSYRDFSLPKDEKYHIEVIDTWNMTVTDCGIHSGQTRVMLPGHEWMAVRLMKVT